jgi:NAD(P)-dependent dehydrogenase (short-subunit alcohol dehydrogenase family)
MATQPTKTVVVTGGNRGLGEETARQLSALGHTVVITSRDAEEGQAAVARIQQGVPNARVEAMALDLSSLASVRKFAQVFSARGVPLDVLINNAGYYNTDATRRVTADGFEQHMGTNHLGHFLLTHLLRDRLQQAAPARVVVLSSGLHAGGMGLKPAHLDFADLQLEKAPYNGLGAYAVSKLCNVLFANELTRRWGSSGVVANSVSPKLVPATVARHTTGFQNFLMKHVLPLLPMARTPQQAAANTVFAALDPSLAVVGGKYLEDNKAVASSAQSMDEAVARRLWDVSLELVGLSGAVTAPVVGVAAGI